MITFTTSESSGYRERTIENAKADATIAIAIDFTTAGEKLTKNAVKQNGKLYIPIDMKIMEFPEERIDKIVRMLTSVKARSLNIAGNGLYTMRNLSYASQKFVDKYVLLLLDKVTKKYPHITSIRSGGQTGVDEAGIKAAVELGIPAVVHAPKDWKFRDQMGYDWTDEKLFKKRFEK